MHVRVHVRAHKRAHVRALVRAHVRVRVREHAYGHVHVSRCICERVFVCITCAVCGRHKGDMRALCGHARGRLRACARAHALAHARLQMFVFICESASAC